VGDLLLQARRRPTRQLSACSGGHLNLRLGRLPTEQRRIKAKSHNARVIDLDAETVRKLRLHRRQQNDERAEWGAEYHDQDLVIAKENGNPIHPHTFSQSFERIIQRAGLRTIRLHDLRHTHASLALKTGVPVKVVSERLGHESPAFTLKQYAHVLPGMQAEAARSVAALVAGQTDVDAA
jgi:integrase